MVSMPTALSPQIPSAARPPVILTADGSQQPSEWGSVQFLAVEKKRLMQEELDCCRKAAEQNDAKATYNLGVYYQKGEGVGKDNTLAFQWFKKAADIGLPEAQLAAGICYYTGSGTSQNFVEAIRLLRPFADQGSPHAQYLLGDYCYYENADYAEAAKWYYLSAEQGHVGSLNNLGICYENGDGLPQSDQKAFECYQKAAAQFHPIALINQGRCYEKGLGTPPSPQLALALRRQAEILGGEEALYTIRVTCPHSQNHLNEEHSASPAS